MKIAMLCRFLLAAFLLVSLVHCDFDEPIESKPTERIDSSLVGKWRWSDVEDAMNVALLAKDDFVYSGQAWPDSEPAKVETFLAWRSVVGDKTYLSVDFGKHERKQFLYARITKLDERTMLYEPVSDDSSFAKDTSGTVKERLERHANDKDLVRDSKRFRKQF